MADSGEAAMEPVAILDELAGWDPDLNLEHYWGERSLFYNPDRERPLGIIWASIKGQDGENDRSSNLDRDGVYRLSFQLSRPEYERRFGTPPTRPPKGGVVEIPGYDPTRLDELLPHPVYAWMRWVMILSPSLARFESLGAPLRESLDAVRERRESTPRPSARTSKLHGTRDHVDDLRATVRWVIQDGDLQQDPDPGTSCGPRRPRCRRAGLDRSAGESRLRAGSDRR